METVRQAFKFPTLLSFVKPVEIFSTSSSGGMYKDASLGLCIEVPQGAVPEGCVLRLEVGMSLYGPFQFPPDTTPIAPILMLCPQEQMVLRKPVLVTLPHIIDQASLFDVEGLGIKVVKADHQALWCSQSQQCYFEDIATVITFDSCEGQEYATFAISHFCFVSLRAKTEREVALRFGYCISPLYPTQAVSSTSQFNYLLAVTYFNRPWLEVSIGGQTCTNLEGGCYSALCIYRL